MIHRHQLLRQKIQDHPALSDEEKADWCALLEDRESSEEPAEGRLQEELAEVGEELADVASELRTSVRRFEAKHPAFTRMADQVLNYLSRMGI